MSENVIPIKGLDHIVLRVRDIDAMLRFYGEVLGCGVEKIQEDLGLWQLRAGDALIDFATVDGPIGREKGPAPGRDGHNQDHFCLLVDPWTRRRFGANSKLTACLSKNRQSATAPPATARRST